MLIIDLGGTKLDLVIITQSMETMRGMRSVYDVGGTSFITNRLINGMQWRYSHSSVERVIINRHDIDYMRGFCAKTKRQKM